MSMPSLAVTAARRSVTLRQHPPRTTTHSDSQTHPLTQLTLTPAHPTPGHTQIDTNHRPNIKNNDRKMWAQAAPHHNLPYTSTHAARGHEIPTHSMPMAYALSWASPSLPPQLPLLSPLLSSPLLSLSDSLSNFPLSLSLSDSECSVVSSLVSLPSDSDPSLFTFTSLLAICPPLHM